MKGLTVLRKEFVMVKARKTVPGGDATDSSLDEGEIMELGVLLPPWEIAALEQMAGREDETVGQLLRRIIKEFLDRTSTAQLTRASDSRSAEVQDWSALVNSKSGPFFQMG